MKTNLEIEFKTLIDEETYEKMLKKFDLENNVFEQINHYFDTEKADLINNHYVLRIRQKGQNFKLTSKSHSKEGAFEKHIFLKGKVWYCTQQCPFKILIIRIALYIVFNCIHC